MSVHEPALLVSGLSKEYGDFVAVDGISFEVPHGSVIGMLGPNGAGKTTTIQMLMGITTPTAGTIEYFGTDFKSQRQACLKRINYTSAYNHLQERLTVRENLLVFAGLYEIFNAKRKIDELAEYFGIDQMMNQQFKKLSAGERTRVNIAKALLNEPDLVMMDEPTASLDPDIRDRFMSLVEDLRRSRQISILYTSHNMDEVARLCDDVIFLSQGSIIRHASPDELAADVHEPSVVLYFEGEDNALQDHFAELAIEAHVENGVATLMLDSRRLPALLASLEEMVGHTLLDIDIRKANLDDAFKHFTRSNHVVVPD